MWVMVKLQSLAALTISNDENIVFHSESNTEVLQSKSTLQSNHREAGEADELFPTPPASSCASLLSPLP